MTARISLNPERARGHRPRLQLNWKVLILLPKHEEWIILQKTFVDFERTKRGTWYGD
jgi:hypothetical protein